MRTTKPVSTISYNTEPFLRYALNELVKARKIAFWTFIKHQKEEDETKDHLHLYIEPNGKIDTMELQGALLETDLKNPDKPLKCVDFRSSKWDDWYFYALHEPEYLKTKFLTRKYHYSNEDFEYSDGDEFTVRMERAWHSDVRMNAKLREIFETGVSVNQMVFNGMIMPSQSFQYRNYADMYQRGRHEVYNRMNDFELVEEQDMKDIPFLDDEITLEGQMNIEQYLAENGKK